MQKSALILLAFFLSTLLFAHEEQNSSASKHTFIINNGQWPESVKFKSEIGEATIYFESNAFHFQFISQTNLHPHSLEKKEKRQFEKQGISRHNFKIKFMGSNENVSFQKQGESSYYHNYFIGNDKSKWQGNVKLYESIVYQELYSGIDLISYTHEGSLKYDYRIAPFANPNQIKVKYIGVEQPVIEKGQLIISHSLGKVMEQKPYAYQVIDNEKVEVSCEFKFNENGLLTFNFPKDYNKELELIIDPILIFSTYSGSTADNFGMSATYDNKGNAYMGGIAYSNGYDTTTGAFQTRFAGLIDISISKFKSAGNILEYSTYIGGTGRETVHSMVVNDNNELFILGATSSSNFPTTSNSYDTIKSNSTYNITSDVGHDFIGGTDIIITKFNNLGTDLLASTYYGGQDIDGLNYSPAPPSGNSSNVELIFNYGDSHRGEIVLDSLGNCYIGTSTNSTGLSSINTKSGRQDGLIAKFKPNLDSLIWSRYHGGRRQDAIYSLKVIDNNRVLVGGGTQSSNFPITSGSYQDQLPGGRADGFISIISADGLTVDKSTFIGTTEYDQVYFIEFDRFNNVYALGQSRGGIFPIKNSKVADSAAGQFIIKLDRNLDSTIFSMTFGNGQNKGVINISPTAFLVDRCQNAFASGWGGSLISTEGTKSLQNNMPITSNAFSAVTDTNDFYLYSINRFADSVIYASYFGGTTSRDHVDGGTSRFDKQGVIYQSVCASCGVGNRTDFPTKNAYSNINRSTNCNNALFKLDFQVLPVADFTTSLDTFCINEANLDTFAINITNNSTRADITTWDFYGTKVTSNFIDTTIFITQAGSYVIRADVEDTVCATGDFKETTIFARPDNINIITSRDTTVCYVDSAQIAAFTNGFANIFTWSKNRNFSNAFPSQDSIITVPLDSGINLFYVLARNNITEACEKIDSIEVNYIPVTSIATISESTVCENTPVLLNAIIDNVDRFVWNLGNGIMDSTNLSITINFPPSSYPIFFEVENFLCVAKDTILLPLDVVANNLMFENLSDTLLCGAQGFTVSKSSLGTASEFLWSSNAAFSDTLNSNPQDSTFSILQSDSAKYYVRISDQYCERIDSLNAEYIEYDLDLSIVEDSACNPFTTELQTTIIGTDSFRILYGNGNSTSSDSTPSVTYTNPGIFIVQLIGSNNKCQRRDTINQVIEVFQSVNVETTKDTSLCFADTLIISGNTFGTANTFIWDISTNFDNPLNLPNDSTLKISPTQNTTYYFKGQNVICEAIDSVFIETELLEIELEDVVSICLEDSFLIEANILSSLSSLSFVWSPNDSIISGQGTSTILTSPREDMTFYLRTTSAIGCEDYDSVEVDVNFPAFTTAEIFSSLDSLFKGQTTQFSTNRNGSNLTYFWEPDSGLTNPNSPNPVLKAIDSKTYKVTITDINTGCIVVAYKRIKVFEVNCGEPDIFIPSAFTPNKDLRNDVLFVRGANVKSINFQLYNRWGEKVFETNELNVGWDGKYKGREVDPGVFVYHLKAICFDDQEYFTKGDITLIR